jgi:hypothetical protein
MTAFATAAHLLLIDRLFSADTTQAGGPTRCHRMGPDAATDAALLILNALKPRT